jgi:Leucine-rich repeat (LRR) protein
MCSLNSKGELIEKDPFSDDKIDISCIVNFKNLKKLELPANGETSDLSILKQIKGIKHLVVQGNQVSDLSFLEGMTDLEYLDLAGN